MEVDLREPVEAVSLLVDIPKLPVESFGDLNLFGTQIRSAEVSLEKANLCRHTSTEDLVVGWETTVVELEGCLFLP